jgi:hypothetical protein
MLRRTANHYQMSQQDALRGQNQFREIQFCVEISAIQVAGSLKTKKEEFPGFMLFMQPGNSFPQICVVSVEQFG